MNSLVKQFSPGNWNYRWSTTPTQYLYAFGDLDSGPHACAEGTFPTDLFEYGPKLAWSWSLELHPGTSGPLPIDLMEVTSLRVLPHLTGTCSGSLPAPASGTTVIIKSLPCRTLTSRLSIPQAELMTLHCDILPSPQLAEQLLW